VLVGEQGNTSGWLDQRHRLLDLYRIELLLE
jgi:hypothetical protein